MQSMHTLIRIMCQKVADFFCCQSGTLCFQSGPINLLQPCQFSNYVSGKCQNWHLGPNCLFLHNMRVLQSNHAVRPLSKNKLTQHRPTHRIQMNNQSITKENPPLRTRKMLNANSYCQLEAMNTQSHKLRKQKMNYSPICGVQTATNSQLSEVQFHYRQSSLPQWNSTVKT